MKLIEDLTTAEQTLIIRAGAHALPDDLVPPAARFQRDVTDLDVARLLMQIERGAVYVPSRTHDGWASLAPTKGMSHLTRIVGEAMRVGLVHPDSVKTGEHTVRTQLVAAPVHLKSAPGRTTCLMSDVVPFGRYRVVDDPDLVDCTACLQAYR